jgi:hypothetical protein
LHFTIGIATVVGETQQICVTRRINDLNEQNVSAMQRKLQNQLKPALFAEFVLPRIHATNTARTCTGVDANPSFPLVLTPARTHTAQIYQTVASLCLEPSFRNRNAALSSARYGSR